jgi:hypothetical protein
MTSHDTNFAGISHDTREDTLPNQECIETYKPRQSFGNSGVQEGLQKDRACPCALSA